MHQVSKPRAANQSITDESRRPGTFRSKVGCEAIEEPCTKSTVPRLCAPAAGSFCQRNSRTFSLPLLIQCSFPDSAARAATCFTSTPPEKMRILTPAARASRDARLRILVKYQLFSRGPPTPSVGDFHDRQHQGCRAQV